MLPFLATYNLRKLGFACAILALWTATASAQISAPGAERERQRLREQMERPIIDRDSVTIRDTVVVFDPTTYEQSVTITVTKYSLRNYCESFLGMRNPEILLDHKPHTIIDPRTYEEMIIRLLPEGRLDTIPN